MIEKREIYDFLVSHYSIEEIRDLMFYLDIDYDLLSGESKASKTRELLSYCTRTARIQDLLEVIAKQRPESYVRTLGRSAHVASDAVIKRERNPKKIFISHATQDTHFAHRLAIDLRAEGFSVWLAPESILPGENWVEAIARGLDECGTFLLIMSPGATASRWVEYETNIALELEDKREMQFIPLAFNVKGVSFPILWQSYQWVSFLDSYEAGLAFLLNRLMGESQTSASLDDRPVSVHSTNAARSIHSRTGVELVRIPAGPFLYGSSDSDELAFDSEKPQRVVDLPEYWIGRYPVTNAQYKRFIESTQHQMPFHWSGIILSEEMLDHPVVNISWNDAKAYCDWAGLTLPTEEQWEKAARGMDGRRWPWGESLPTGADCNIDGSVGSTTPVGRYSPRGDSPYGVADMAGNIWEWTHSWYDVTENAHVLRGGAWDSPPAQTRAAYRELGIATLQLPTTGFRTCRPSSQ